MLYPSNVFTKENSIDRLIQKSVLDSLRDAILILNREMKVIDVNLAFVNLFRIQEKDLVTKSDKEFYEELFDYFDENSQSEFETMVSKVLDPSKLIGEEFEAKIIKPRPVFLKIYTAPVYDNREGLLGRIWKFENINDKKLIDNMKTEFISIASHQLRTPLTAINGNLDMISKGDFGEVSKDVAQGLADVQQAAKNLIEIVNGLLDVSRMEMDKIEPSFSKVDLSDLIKSIINEFETLVKEKKLNINEFMIEDDVIKTDSKLLSEALKNYISNAIKYTPDSGDIDVEVTKEDHYVRIEIKDSGIGIPEDQLDGLFTKFFRADNVLIQNFEGTGLGLYYVKKIAEALEGEVGYEPNKPSGSIFWIKLPLNYSDTGVTGTA